MGRRIVKLVTHTPSLKSTLYENLASLVINCSERHLSNWLENGQAHCKAGCARSITEIPQVKVQLSEWQVTLHLLSVGQYV